jgi:hypothetical protein
MFGLLGIGAFFLGVMGLVAELGNPVLRLAPEHGTNIKMCLAAAGVGVLFVWLELYIRELPRREFRGRNARTEQGYVIVRTCDGYKMTVGREAMSRALGTREYEYIGKADHDALRYTGLAGNGASFDGVIPRGHVFTGMVYQDGRLNNDLENMLIAEDEFLLGDELDTIRNNVRYL